MRTALRRLTLTDFRCYARADVVLEGGAVYLFGPNGAGKTNFLEAISFLAPGRGLRGAAIADVGRREAGEAQGRAWAVSAKVEDAQGETQVGCGTDVAGASRRSVRIDGAPAQPARLAEIVRLVWLTPQQDRLFLDGAAERRRFLDRLVFADEPAHAANVLAYERALRERTRLLEDAAPDPAWLSALEARMAGSGARVARARARVLLALQAEIDTRADRPFPLARLGLSGDWEALALDGAAEAEIEGRLAAALAAARPRDAAAGRALVGPHRGDLQVSYQQKGRPAAESSTGEQKALILNLVLAQGARLSRADSAPNPILLLDEVAAHLDSPRRAALFDEIEALGLQAFLSGTDEALFSQLEGRGQGVRVDAGRLGVTEDP